MSKDLYDAILRHQIYVESYKANEVKYFIRLINDLRVEIRAIFAKLNYETMAGVTRIQLTRFLSSLTKLYDKLMKRFNKLFLQRLRGFFTVDRDMIDYVYNRAFIDNQTVTIPDDAPPEDEENLWIWLIGFPLAASGQSIRDTIKGFIAASRMMIENQVRRGWVDRAPVNQVIGAIVGNNQNPNGLFGRITNQVTAVINSAIHHITNGVQNVLGMRRTDEYMWSSIMDEKTTDICRSRNKKVYKYSDGPVPPAHYNCRSIIIPILEKFTPDRGFSSWFRRQPDDVRTDILSIARGIDFRVSPQYTSVNYLSSFAGPRNGLTLEQFKAKRALIIAGLFGR